MKRPIPIQIAGQRYVVRSDADESYVQSLARSVDTRVNALKGSRMIATQADVVLAALQLADELHRQKEQKRQIRERSQRLLDYLTQLGAGAGQAVEPGQGS